MRHVAAWVLVMMVGGASVVAASVTREFAWEYGDRRWMLTHSFALEDYERARSLPHPVSVSQYANYVLDPTNDGPLASFVSSLEGLAQGGGLNMWEKLNLTVTFVQSLRYIPEIVEYPRYPIETLVDGGGDCEDLAILAAAVLRQMGFGVVLLAFTEEMHMAVGVRVLPPAATEETNAYIWNGDAYYYLETTAYGWTIGTAPEEFSSAPQIIALMTR